MSPIRKFRTERGMTQAELGRLLGVKQDRISALENERADPKLSTLKKVVRELQIDPRDFFFETPVDSVSSTASEIVAE
jgi:transcriptional regulator with XRE-family HTH domain